MKKQILYNFFGKNFDLDFKNWFKSKTGFDFEQRFENQKYFSLKQIHSDKIFYLDDFSKLSDSGLIEADAIITNLEEIFICVQTADCVPILIFDENSKTISAIHSGHAGSFLEITKKTIDQLSKKIKDFDAKNLKVSIGPHIFCQDYEVGSEFFEKWTQKDCKNKKYFFSHQGDPSKYFFDNHKCVFDQLVESGILEKNIEISKINTFSDENFYSHRQKCQKNERNLGLIGIF